MKKTFLSLLVFGSAAFCVISSSAQTKNSAPKSKPEQDSVVITFKDGHTQRYPLADVAKIEFESPSTTPTETSSSGHFLGTWKIGNSSENFTITLKRDGQASKTINNFTSSGAWKVIGDEARITWEDGWHDTIRRAGNRYEKVAFRPGKTFTDSPDNIEDAKTNDPI
jgi:hypothetical protein